MVMVALSNAELLKVLERVIRASGVSSAVGSSEVVEPGLVRLRVLERGGFSFLMGRDGGILRYVFPAMMDDDAVDAFKAGRRSDLSAEVLRQAGFRS